MLKFLICYHFLHIRLQAVDSQNFYCFARYATFPREFLSKLKKFECESFYEFVVMSSPYFFHETIFNLIYKYKEISETFYSEKYVL